MKIRITLIILVLLTCCLASCGGEDKIETSLWNVTCFEWSHLVEKGVIGGAYVEYHTYPEGELVYLPHENCVFVEVLGGTP